jgi:hypothetical protein
MPLFHQPVYFQQEADTLKFGALATPFVVDWDGDGLDDILCGNTAGNIGFFKNLGSGENDLPKWAAPVLIEEAAGVPFRVLAGPSGSIQGPCEAKWGYTTLSVADWDGDGQLDIIYNSILGRIGLLRGTGNPLRVIPAPFDTGQRELPPKWQWWQVPASDTLTQWRTTPLAVDFDGDGASTSWRSTRRVISPCAQGVVQPGASSSMKTTNRCGSIPALAAAADG